MFRNFVLKEKGGAAFIDVHTCGAAGLGCPMGADTRCSVH